MTTLYKSNFSENGYIVISNLLSDEIKQVQAQLSNKSKFFFSNIQIDNPESIHQFISPDELNKYRMEMINYANKDWNVRAKILLKMEKILIDFLGPDIVAQKNINMVISMPNDLTSQIPFHSDIWTGHSPFELNIWVPIYDTEPESSMYIVPLFKWNLLKEKIDFKHETINSLEDKFKKEFEYVQIKAGDVLLFWHHLPHGNHKHFKEKTRFSFNLRVKNLFSPYGEKGFGDYFVPFKSSVLTQMVLDEGRFLL